MDEPNLLVDSSFSRIFNQKIKGVLVVEQRFLGVSKNEIQVSNQIGVPLIFEGLKLLGRQA
jgi:hypothetical protein